MPNGDHSQMLGKVKELGAPPTWELKTIWHCRSLGEFISVPAGVWPAEEGP